MRTTTVFAAAMALVFLSTAARADGPVPPVMVGQVVITDYEAEEMLDVLAHHHHHHYRAGEAVSWLVPSPIPPTLAPEMPSVMVNGVYITGREAEDMISKLSRMRHHGRYRAGMALDWLGIPTVLAYASAPLMVPLPPAIPMPVMMPPPPVFAQVVVPAPVMFVPAPPVAPVAAKRIEPDLSRALIGVSAEASRGQAAMGVSLAYEGRRWGFNLNGAMTIHQNDQNQQTRIRIVDAHLVFAPITGPRGRIRIEAGASMAEGLDGVFMFGPDVGLSGDVRIVGPFGVFGAARGTFWPYTRWDVYGGLFVKAWFLRVELGWREMRLNGKLQDGTAVCDKWSGPFLGTTLVF
jgi:hypothetical protein